MGNLTRDPELRYTPAGTAIASFGIAINEKWKDADGLFPHLLTYWRMINKIPNKRNKLIY